MKSCLKIILASAFLILCSAGSFHAADVPEGTDINADSFAGQYAVDEWMVKKAEFQTKMEKFNTIRNAVEECVKASGIDIEKADRETIERTVEKCLVTAGIDAEARRAEMEAFKAAVGAMRACIKTTALFDDEMINPENIDLDALKNDLKQCLAEAGFDWEAWAPEFGMGDRNVKNATDSSSDKQAGGCSNSRLNTGSRSNTRGGGCSAVPADGGTGTGTGISTDDEMGTGTGTGTGTSTDTDTNTNTNTNTDTDKGKGGGQSGGPGVQVPVDANVPMKVAPGCMIDSLLHL